MIRLVAAPAAPLRDHSEQLTIVGMLRGHDPTGVPLPDEAASYYFKYIDRIASADIVSVLEAQLEDALAFFSAMPAEASLFRYAPDKWSVRQVLGHINDCERLFVSRAFWFARGFDSELPSFDQNVCDAAAHADQVDWADHVEEFRALRLSTLDHHLAILREQYVRPSGAQ